MLQQEAPCDLVFRTGETHSVLECVEEAFGYVNLDWREHVAEDPRYLRPTEVPLLQADPSEAKRRLGWEPGVTFRDLVRIMMDADVEAAGLPAPGQGTHCLTDGTNRSTASSRTLKDEIVPSPLEEALQTVQVLDPVIVEATEMLVTSA